MEHTLWEISSAVGTLLVIEAATFKRNFGHYARVLVDMDFSKKLFHDIMNLCHDVTNCRWLYPRKENIINKEKVVKGKSQVPSKKLDWVPIHENPPRIGSSKAFEVPPPKAPLKIVPIVEDVVANKVPQPQTQQASESFNFDLQNVFEEIPHGDPLAWCWN
uniref:Uncharacterized protein n=1 Tax=Medicago truncatula TaxID=3880 RepID=A2Q3N0_MEDTR|nr:hypothetical protein MtrDRAFT_AC155886g7v2 [Medicago truncatula]